MTTDTRNEIRDLAEEMAEAHASSPEVQAGGGPEAKDEEGFDDTGLRERLAEAGIEANEDNMEALRLALRAALADMEAEAAEDAKMADAEERDAARQAEVEKDEAERAVYVYAEHCNVSAGRRYPEEKAEDNGELRSEQGDAVRFVPSDLPDVDARAAVTMHLAGSGSYWRRVAATLRKAWDVPETDEIEDGDQ